MFCSLCSTSDQPPPPRPLLLPPFLTLLFLTLHTLLPLWTLSLCVEILIFSLTEFNCQQTDKRVQQLQSSSMENIWFFSRFSLLTALSEVSTKKLRCCNLREDVSSKLNNHLDPVLHNNQSALSQENSPRTARLILNRASAIVTVGPATTCDCHWTYSQHCGYSAQSELEDGQEDDIGESVLGLLGN